MPNENIPNVDLNIFGPSPQIKELKSQSETALTSHYVFFDKEVFNNFKNYCQKYRNKLKTNEYILKYLTKKDIAKLSQDGNDDVVMKLFIAINHTAGYAEERDGHIGLKLVGNFGEEFALKWFQLRATSAHIESCKKDAETTISISNFANIDGNIFGTNRKNFEDSLSEREVVVLAQLESALSKIADLPDNSKIKESIQKLTNQIKTKNYPIKPNVDQIKQATQAITYANLINAMYSVPKNSVILYSRPNLFLPRKIGYNQKQVACEPEDFKKMVQDVVNDTGRSIISDGVFYQENGKTIKLYENSMINNVGDIKSIAEKLKEESPDSELVIGCNGAVHQMTPGVMEDWNPTVGKNFIKTENKPRLALEELMRKIFNQLRFVFLNTDVKITAELFGEKKVLIGYAKYCNRQEENKQMLLEKGQPKKWYPSIKKRYSFLNFFKTRPPVTDKQNAAVETNAVETNKETVTVTGKGHIETDLINRGETTSGGRLPVNGIGSGSVSQAFQEPVTWTGKGSATNKGETTLIPVDVIGSGSVSQAGKENETGEPHHKPEQVKKVQFEACYYKQEPVTETETGTGTGTGEGPATTSSINERKTKLGDFIGSDSVSQAVKENKIGEQPPVDNETVSDKLSDQPIATEEFEIKPCKTPTCSFCQNLSLLDIFKGCR